jgi:hypothetical protein
VEMNALAYPKIPGSKQAPSGRCVAFEKYDGTNLHWDWDHEFGWATFGTRRDFFYLDAAGIAAFHAAHPGLDDAPDLFQRDLAAPLETLFHAHDFYASTKISVFTEYLGASSFAGMHVKDDPKRLVLFDVRTASGFLGPEQFAADFVTLPLARIVFRGKLTGQFMEDVRRGRYNVAEGVVCKGGAGGGDVWMVKIKTNAYLAKLQQAFKERWKDYWE